jgi:hypothetical protein
MYLQKEISQKIRRKIIFLLNLLASWRLLMKRAGSGSRAGSVKQTKLILLDSLLQEVEATLPHLVFQKKKIK